MELQVKRGASSMDPGAYHSFGLALTLALLLNMPCNLEPKIRSPKRLGFNLLYLSIFNNHIHHHRSFFVLSLFFGFYNFYLVTGEFSSFLIRRKNKFVLKHLSHSPCVSFLPPSLPRKVKPELFPDTSAGPLFPHPQNLPEHSSRAQHCAFPLPEPFFPKLHSLLQYPPHSFIPDFSMWAIGGEKLRTPGAGILRFAYNHWSAAC